MDTHAHAHTRKHSDIVRQKANNGQRDKAARLCEELARGGRQAYLEEIRHGTPIPSPGGKGLSMQKSVPARKAQIACKAKHGTGKGCPSYSCRAAGRKSKVSQAEAEVSKSIGHGHDQKREQGQEYLLIGPKDGIHHDEHIVEGELTAVCRKEYRKRRAQLRGNTHDREKERSKKQGKIRYSCAHARGKRDNESSVTARPERQTRP